MLKDDISRFIPDQDRLKIWSPQYFHDLSEKLKIEDGKNAILISPYFTQTKPLPLRGCGYLVADFESSAEGLFRTSSNAANSIINDIWFNFIYIMITYFAPSTFVAFFASSG